MKLYGACIAFNIHARNAKEAQEVVDEYLTKLRNDNGEDRESEASVDMAEENGELEELE